MRAIISYILAIYNSIIFNLYIIKYNIQLYIIRYFCGILQPSIPYLQSAFLFNGGDGKKIDITRLLNSYIVVYGEPTISNLWDLLIVAGHYVDKYDHIIVVPFLTGGDKLMISMNPDAHVFGEVRVISRIINHYRSTERDSAN